MLTNSNILLITLFTLNLILSAVIALILIFCCPPHTSRKYSWLLFTSIGVFVPFSGILIAIWLVCFSRHYYDRAANLDIQTFSMPDLINEKGTAVAVYAPGWAEVRLAGPHFPKQERVHALNIINKNIDYSVNKLNWALLIDEVEELRLYAFSLIEKQRNHFNKNINKLIQLCKSAQSPEQTALIEKQLAAQYWEMIALNLIERELREIILKKCYFYAEKAIKILTHDADLWCLLAHYYFATNQPQQAIAALSSAQQLKAPNSRTLPYIAEYSFQNHDYTQVKKYLSADNSFWEIPTLGKIVNFWCQP